MRSSQKSDAAVIASSLTHSLNPHKTSHTQARLRDPPLLHSLCTSLQACSSSCDATQALCGVSSITLLAAGAQSSTHKACSADLFSHPSTAYAYAHAVCKLMGVCLATASVQQLLHRAEGQAKQGGDKQQQQQLGNENQEEVVRLGQAIEGLWPLAQRPFILQLLTQLSAVQGGVAVSDFCDEACVVCFDEIGRL